MSVKKLNKRFAPMKKLRLLKNLKGMDGTLYIKVAQ